MNREQGAQTIVRKVFLTQDIILYNCEKLKTREIEQLDFCAQKIIMEEELREYIGRKFKELNHPLKKEALQKYSVASLINGLSNLKSDEKSKIINSFTHYVIRFMFQFQKIEVTWKLVSVKNSTILSINDYEYDLLSPKDYNALEVFQTMWNFFQIFSLNENKKRA